MDAIRLLKKDHQEVTKLFQRFNAAKGGRGAESTVDKLCKELEVHAQIEEEILYPAVRRADSSLANRVDEAFREHAEVKQQVSALQSRDRGEGDELAADVAALQQSVEHHVTEEEGEMFPRAMEVMDERQRADLGRQLDERKQQLTGRGSRPARRTDGASRKATARDGRGDKAAGPQRRKTARARTTRTRKIGRKRARSR